MLQYFVEYLKCDHAGAWSGQESEAFGTHYAQAAARARAISRKQSVDLVALVAIVEHGVMASEIGRARYKAGRRVSIEGRIR